MIDIKLLVGTIFFFGVLTLADDNPNGIPPAFLGQTKTRRMISLAESINITQRSLTDPEVIKIRRQYWKDTFDDIRKLASGSKSTAPRPSAWSSNQWKLLSSPNPIVAQEQSESSRDILDSQTGNETAATTIGPRRFEGFPSWERLLQDWSDDIQEYLDRVDAESGEGYSFGNFGRAPPRPSENSDKDIEPPVATIAEESPKEKKWTPLPIPEPRKEGEEVLPHTDMSDKSKRILIVTTASLPWRTGTAVNPLLRAAYLCNGRKDLGGSVTLMLPWLERREDQVRVYGDLAFDSTEAQEQFIRSWLLDSADMQEASENLQIRWYTAWQNKVENSIYSMGDITSLVSSDDIDICILEEPEHLNWYRGPGESWTKKFDHVVGILHTNYFQYALDQPAAVLRVSVSDQYLLFCPNSHLGSSNEIALLVDVSRSLPSRH